MQPLPAGNLRHKLTARRAQEVPTGKGGFDSDWGDVVSFYAEVLGLDGRESVMDQVLEGISVFRIRIRWRSDLLASDQLQPADEADPCFGRNAERDPRTVNIRSIVDPDGRREQLVIIADTASIRS